MHTAYIVDVVRTAVGRHKGTIATMVHGLRAPGGNGGFQAMCEGGGIANVTIIELL